MSRTRLAWAAAALLSLAPLPALASVETTTGYTKEQAYHAALRYLRVDLSYEVVERDPDAAYLLFRFMPEGRKGNANGSIEIVERREGIRVTIRLPELPRYQEQVLSDGLLRKLETEYGEPPPREDAPRDKDKDKDREKDKDRGGSGNEKTKKDDKKSPEDQSSDDR